MSEERTMVDALAALAAQGFEERFQAAEDGQLVAQPSGERYPPEDLHVEEVVRLEGRSDPEDMAMILALRAERDGRRGTYTVPYGTAISARDAEVLPRLDDARSTHRS